MNQLEQGRKRIYSLDALKAIAAFLVCYQHACGTGVISEYLLAFSRVAVPIFMLITGFMYKDVLSRNREKGQIKKFLLIGIEMGILWFALDFVFYFLKHDLGSYLSGFISAENIFRFLVFNDPVAADHAWYIWAVLYALILLYFFPKIITNRTIKWILIGGGLILQLILGKYSLLVFGVDMPSYITRNAWTVGIPYLLLGNELREVFDKGKLPSCGRMGVFLGVACLLLVAERFALVQSGRVGTRDMYIMTTVLALTIVALFLKLDGIGKDSFLAKIGVRYSLVIYIVHPAFVRVEKKFLPMDTGWQYVGVIAVFVAALIVAVVWGNIRNYLRKKVA